MKEPTQKLLRFIALELAAYTVIAIIYFCLVLRFLGSWLDGLFREQRTSYVLASVLLMIGQSIGLERLVTALRYVIRSGKK